MDEVNILEWSYLASVAVCEYALKILLTAFFIVLHVWAMVAAAILIFYGSVLLFHSITSCVAKARNQAELERTMDPRMRRF